MKISQIAGLFSLGLVSVLLFTSQLVIPSIAVALDYPDKHGPYLDYIEYKVLTGDDLQNEALINGEIDVIGDMISSSSLTQLEAADDIKVDRTLRNGYSYLTINTAKNPFNYTSFRRAAAFAYNKTAVCEIAWAGLAEPLDASIPKMNPFSCEGLLDFCYYDGDIETANKLLDDAGFSIDSISGYRLDPHGNPFSVTIECAQSSDIAIICGDLMAEALQTINVDAVNVPTDFYEYLNRLYFHGDYDMVFLGSSFNGYDVDWLAYEFWSVYADDPYCYCNYPQWRNATYDSWRDQLLHGTSFEAVYEAAFKMQEILAYDCPIIICYENILLTGYRTDKFENFVTTSDSGAYGWWTLYNTRLKQGQAGAPWGGALRISSPLDFDSFNPFLTASCYCQSFEFEIYDSLLKPGPDGILLPWLAESYTIETHDDNPAIVDGHTRFTFKILDNATWTDGEPLNAEDVVYALNYYRDAPGSPLGIDLSEMTAAYTPSTGRAVVEFSSVSYWHLSVLVSKPILPKHVLMDLGLEGWNTWDPNPMEEEIVTSGPWKIYEFVPGNHTTLVRNEDYFYSPRIREPYPSTVQTTTSTAVTPSTNTGSIITQTTSVTASTTEPVAPAPSLDELLASAGLAITIGSLTVIVVLSVQILRNSKFSRPS